MKAPVNKIIDLSTVDGPGLRTSIFFQKCNIACLYCHNPETQNICCHCGLCVSSCPGGALSLEDGKVTYRKEKCVSCDTCIALCPHHASPKIEYLSPEEVYQRIQNNFGFIRGITVSGGECSLYPEFLTELFKLVKKNHLSCLMDSNGMVDLSFYPDLLQVTDGVMLDIKSWDQKIYHNLTGADNTTVKKNLVLLDSLSKIEELRIVCIPGFVDVKACLSGIVETIEKEHVSKTKIKLIKFRKNGVKGVLKDQESPSDEEMESYRQYAYSLGFTEVVIR